MSRFPGYSHSRTEHDVIEPVVTQGLLMVKPHAVELGLDHVVESLLRGNDDYIDPLADPALGEAIGRIEVQEVISRDLRTARHGRYLVDLFYGDKTSRRYYPLIQEWYLGKVIFISFMLSSSLTDCVLPDLEIIKGRTQTFTPEGEVLDPSSGIRGVLGSPYSIHHPGTLGAMDDDEYRAAIMPVIQNFIHVCDNPGEAELAVNSIV